MYQPSLTFRINVGLHRCTFSPLLRGLFWIWLDAGPAEREVVLERLWQKLNTIGDGALTDLCHVRGANRRRKAG